MATRAHPAGGAVSPQTGGSEAAGPRSALESVRAGASAGVGSLPHRNARHAAEFALSAFDLPTIPSLPRRSPAESAIAQALVGLSGVALGQYGTLAVDVDRLDPEAEVANDLGQDNFVGFRTFLEHAVSVGYDGPVKWQFVGPISVGVALRRAGAPADLAFDVALRSIRGRLLFLVDEVRRVLPLSPQLVVLDEPLADGLMSRDFPIPPGEAVDLLSAAMATIEATTTVGVHCCGDVDITTLLESGPCVLSLPVSTSLIPSAGYLDRFLRHGGWIAWGAVATAGPIGVTSTRSWHRLSSLWHELEQRGCDPVMLREQCLLTPECGLGAHSPDVAERVCRSLRDVSRSVRSLQLA